MGRDQRSHTASTSNPRITNPPETWSLRWMWAVWLMAFLLSRASPCRVCSRCAPRHGNRSKYKTTCSPSPLEEYPDRRCVPRLARTNALPNGNGDIPDCCRLMQLDILRARFCFQVVDIQMPQAAELGLERDCESSRDSIQTESRSLRSSI
jgi:hypothetical protein